MEGSREEGTSCDAVIIGDAFCSSRPRLSSTDNKVNKRNEKANSHNREPWRL